VGHRVLLQDKVVVHLDMTHRMVRVGLLVQTGKTPSGDHQGVQTVKVERVFHTAVLSDNVEVRVVGFIQMVKLELFNKQLVKLVLRYSTVLKEVSVQTHS
jgi:hypothetical protein